MNEDYNNIIAKFSKLKEVKASRDFRKKVGLLLVPSIAKKRNFRYSNIFSLRMALLTILIFLMAGSGVVMASEKATVGSLLYPVKKTVEEVKLSLAKNPSTKALIHINNSDDYIKEMRKSIETEKPKDVSAISEEYKKDVQSAVENIQLNKSENNKAQSEVSNHLEKNTEELNKLQTIAPSQSQKALGEAVQETERAKKDIAESHTQNKSTNQEKSDQNQNLNGKGNKEK